MLFKKKYIYTTDDDCFVRIKLGTFHKNQGRRSFSLTIRRRAPVAAKAETMIVEEHENNVPLMINILSALFKRTANQNDEIVVSQQQQHHAPRPAEAFSGLVRPAISIRRYLNRIYLNTDCSTCCYVIAYIYVDRFLHFNPSVIIDSFNAHRFLITAILTSVKFMDGRNYGNAHFANVGGISVPEMNELEVDFLFGLRFNLNVTPIIYTDYCSFLQGQMSILNTEVPRILQFASSEEQEDSE